MRSVIAASIAAAVAALTYVVCGYFANDAAKGIATGFSPGELKIIPWIVFILTYVGISKSGTQAKPTEFQGKSEPTGRSSQKAGKTETADEGNADAEHQLATKYFNGDGVPKDVAQAARLWQKAAEHGSRDAQFKLGMAYHMSIGVVQNYGVAMQWFQKAAERGDADAQFNLGLMYGKGQGVPAPDMVSAYTWILIASSSGHTTAPSITKRFEAELATNQVAEAKRRAAKFEPKH